jgi:uncharacterized repeat protein (TIGR01451 family)
LLLLTVLLLFAAALRTPVARAANPADLSVTMTASPDPVLRAGTIIYEITLTNAGPGTATNVVVSDVIPNSTTWDTNSWPATGGWACNYPNSVFPAT